MKRKWNTILAAAALGCLFVGLPAQAQLRPRGRVLPYCGANADLEITPVQGFESLKGEYGPQLMAGETFENWASVKNLTNNCHTSPDGFLVFVFYGSDVLATKYVSKSLGPGGSEQVLLTGTAPHTISGVQPVLKVYPNFVDINWNNNEWPISFDEWHGQHVVPSWVDIKNNGSIGWPSPYHCYVVSFRNDGDQVSCPLLEYRLYSYNRDLNTRTQVCGSYWRNLPAIDPGDTAHDKYATCLGQVTSSDQWLIEFRSIFLENCLTWPPTCNSRYCGSEWVTPGERQWGFVDFCPP